MKAIIIASIAIAVFLFTLLLSKSKKLSADFYLLIYLAYFIVTEFFFYWEATGELQHSTLMILGRGFYLMGGPLFYLYVFTLTKGKPPKWKWRLLMFLPCVLYLIAFLYYETYVFHQDQVVVKERLLYVDGRLSWIWTVFIALFLTTDPFYIVLFYFLRKEYQKKVEQSLSFTDRVNLNWLSILFYIWLITAFVLFPVVLFSIGNDHVSNDVVNILVQLVNVVFIFVAGFFGFRQTSVFIAPSEIANVLAEKKASYGKSGLSQAMALAYHQQLLAVMDRDKPFLDGELTLVDLARRVGISVNHLSQVLNQEQKQNFFDFVNGYRVREVQARMADPGSQQFTLLAIALESGFNSKTAFNTAFKKITGSTPSKYQQSVKKKPA